MIFVSKTKSQPLSLPYIAYKVKPTQLCEKDKIMGRWLSLSDMQKDQFTDVII